MSQHQRNPDGHPISRTIAVTATAALTVLTLTTGAGATRASQDQGARIADVGRPDYCSLQRVGTQYVRCDDNTGNGVPAPAWIPER